MKYFGWYLRHCYRDEMEPFGPYFANWNDKIGSKQMHTLEEMLQLPLSESLKQRLRGAKEGTVIKIGRFALNSDQVVICLPTDLVEARDATRQELDEVKTEIAKHPLWGKQVELEQTLDELQKRFKTLATKREKRRKRG